MAPVRTMDEIVKDFRHIDDAVVSAGLVPRLHDLFTERRIEERYLVSDAYEMARGMPLEVRTRTILPLFVDVEGGEAPIRLYPGFVVSEVHGLGGTTVLVQAGLDSEDYGKVQVRLAAIMGREPELGEVRPHWWRYSSPVSDLSGHALSEGGFYGSVQAQHCGMGAIDPFLWGKYKRDERLVEFDVRKEVGGIVTQYLPLEYEAELARGLAVARELIDEVLHHSEKQ